MLIGTAGHIDHGKTTLLRALTGVDTDRLPEEKARGITVDLGYAYSPLPDGRILGFVDVPGHERLIHNMLAGVSGIDFVLLVIAADDGPMSQTREHLELLDLLGLQRGAVALSKIDAVDPQRRAEAEAEITALLAGTRLAHSPVFTVSAPTGEGVAALRTHLQETAAAVPLRSADGRFRLAIDRSFTLPGVGTVVTGTVHSGRVAVGDSLVIGPAGFPARVRGLHVKDRPALQGQAGDRCALALKGDFSRQDVGRGMWLVDGALAIPLSRFQAELRVPPQQKPVTHMQVVHLHLGTDDIPARLALLEGQEAAPGSRALVEILLERETLALVGDRFILRDAGARRTVAGGRVLDIFPPRRHKRSPQRLAWLRGLDRTDPAASLVQLAAGSPSGIDLGRLALAWNLGEAQAQALWQSSGLRLVRDAATMLGVDQAVWQTLAAKLLASLAEEHTRAPDMIGVTRERLRRMTSAQLSPVLFSALVAELMAAGALAQTRAWLHLPQHRARVSVADRDLFAVLRPLLDAHWFNPPRVRDVATATGVPEDTVRRLFKTLARAGELYPVAHDHYFTATAVAELAELVGQLAESPTGARIASLRDALASLQPAGAVDPGGSGGSGGRRVATRILEFFDRVGYTRRVRDAHVLRGKSDASYGTAF